MTSNVNFDDVLKNAYVDTYFQPVAGLATGALIGYEALSRGPKGTNLYMPTSLIAEAKSRNKLAELDHLLRKMALVNASKRGIHKLLFINIDPVVLYDGKPADNIICRCDEFGLSPQRVVVEVSENNAVCSFDKFQNVIKSYKSMGFPVACDGVSCAFTNINAMSCISPDYIKIDGSFVRGIDKSAGDTREKLNAVISIARMINSKVIAVGVETCGELTALYKMGVDAVQGNLIGAPNNEFKPISKNGAEMIAALSASAAG